MEVRPQEIMNTRLSPDARLFLLLIHSLASASFFLQTAFCVVSTVCWPT